MAFQPYQSFPNNNQYYMQSLQDMRDRLDNQIRSYQQNQMQQPFTQPQIHQSFQLAPQTSNSDIQAKYVSDIEEVKNTFVIGLGLFIDKDIKNLWVKNINGDIRSFTVKEIIQQDPKDIEINELKKELESVKNMLNSSQLNENNLKTSKTTKK